MTSCDIERKDAMNPAFFLANLHTYIRNQSINLKMFKVDQIRHGNPRERGWFVKGQTYPDMPTRFDAERPNSAR